MQRSFYAISFFQNTGRKTCLWRLCLYRTAALSGETGDTAFCDPFDGRLLENRLSLYVYLDDSEIFYEAYASVFGNGIYQNEKEGPLDVCGLNYYPADRKKVMIEALQEKKPTDCERLTEWLTSGESSFGFYLLGL